MTIKIGGKTHAISRTGELDARMIESTGFSVAENANVLAGCTNPAYLARVLSPMLTDPMPVGELAAVIATAGVDGVRMDVLALLTASPEPVKKGKGDGEA